LPPLSVRGLAPDGMPSAYLRTEGYIAHHARRKTLEVYVRNLMSRNISIVEYMDFMEVHKSTRQSVLDVRNNVALMFEELQFAVGAEIKE